MPAFFEASKLYNICSSSYPNHSATFRDQLLVKLMNQITSKTPFWRKPHAFMLVSAFISCLSTNPKKNFFDLKKFYRDIKGFSFLSKEIFSIDHLHIP